MCALARVRVLFVCCVCVVCSHVDLCVCVCCARARARVRKLCACACMPECVCISPTNVPQVFTPDVDFQDKIAAALVPVAVFMWLDGFQCIGQGIFRGVAKQTTGAVIALLGYYGASLPAAFALGFKAHLGLQGMYMGACIGYSVVGILTLVAICRLDWGAASDKAIATARGGKGSGKEGEEEEGTVGQSVEMTALPQEEEGAEEEEGEEEEGAPLVVEHPRSRAASLGSV